MAFDAKDGRKLLILRTMSHLFILKLDDSVAINETDVASCGEANILVWSLVLAIYSLFSSIGLKFTAIYR